MSSPRGTCRPRRRYAATAVLLACSFIASQRTIFAEAPESDDDRILGVIPNFLTVSDPNSGYEPLSVREKWKLFARESFDPFTGASALMGAAFSQRGNNHPKYGNGGQAYAQRVGAAIGDFTSQNLFSAAVLASVLHQDPRYFRKGPSKGIVTRIGYSASRIVIANQDSGRLAFNASGVLGMGLGIAASNLYYPAGSRSGAVMRGRISTSLMGGVIGNLLAEFWPDIRTRVLSRFGPWKKKSAKV
jgi:hypothetical protein